MELLSEDKLKEKYPEVKLIYKDNVLQGFIPSSFMFGYTYHSHMVPPIKPYSMLVLGYGVGTIADLTRKIWGSDVLITGIDKEFPSTPYIEYKLFRMDAYKYVKECTDGIIKKRFDYIVIDLFEGGDECDFIFWSDFAKRISQMSKMLVCLNINRKNVHRLKYFYESMNFDYHSVVGEQMITFWRTKE